MLTGSEVRFLIVILQVDWQVEVERASANFITYWITIKNLTSLPVNIEARYAMLN